MKVMAGKQRLQVCLHNKSSPFIMRLPIIFCSELFTFKNSNLRILFWHCLHSGCPINMVTNADENPREMTLNLIKFWLLFNCSGPLSFYFCNSILTCSRFLYPDSLPGHRQKWNTQEINMSIVESLLGFELEGSEQTKDLVIFKN